MALSFVRRSTLPAPVKGKVGTLQVGISGSGQIQLSTLATKFMNGSKTCVMGFDAGKVYIFKSDAKLVAKVAKEDQISINYPKNGGTSFFSGGAILKDANTFGDHIYDYSNSGNQTFPATIDEKNGCLVFSLPKGKLTPKPVTPRVKKETSNGASATPVVEDDELILTSA